MKNEGAAFFMGTNTADGYVSLFPELFDAKDGWTVYLIKGGPGTGKSGLMKRIAQEAQQRGYLVQRVYCSSDPKSLDAVRIPALKVCLLDATAPHTLDPQYPGAAETIVNLGEAWNEKKLQENAQRIFTLTDCNKDLHRRSVLFFQAAACAMEDSRRRGLRTLSTEKIERYAQRFAARELICSNAKGEEKRCFLNGNTPNGFLTMFDTAEFYCDKIIRITDETGAAAGELMENLRRYAIGNGVRVLTCLNPFLPNGRPLHVIFPEERIGFFTDNFLQHFTPYAHKTLRGARFEKADEPVSGKQRIQFNKKAATQFIGDGVALLDKAKKVHDELEQFYIDAMDFERVNQITEDLMKEIFG